MLDIIKHRHDYYTQKEMVLKINELVVMFNTLFQAAAVDAGEDTLASQIAVKIKEQEAELDKFEDDLEEIDEEE